MYGVLTSPITLLCLGVVFLLISLLFFYFKRSISRLERAQMEQARVLQSFITNMEMSRQQHMMQPTMTQPLHNHVGGVHENGFVQDSNEQSLIDVSDGSDDESDDESDDDSDDESDDSDDEIDSDAETANNENVSSVSNNGMSILEIDELGNSEDDGEREIKVIQLQDNHLEEIHPEIVEVSEMPNTVSDAQYNINIVNNSNSNSDDSDSDSEDEDESGSDIGNDSDHNGDIGMNMSNISDNLLNVEEIHSIKKIPSVQELMTSSDVKEEIISTDLKTLTLQKLRQIAIDKDLIQTGSKTNKKELIKMIEEATK